jgi:hypothetical protein
MGSKSSSAVRYPWLDRRSLANRLSYQPCPPSRTCCLAPIICSSLPSRLRFTRASAIGKSKRGRGAVRIRSRDVLWAAKAAPPSVTLGCPAVHWQIDCLSDLPRHRTCCFALNICSSLPWGLGFTGLPGIDRSSMMAGKSALPWDVGTWGRGSRPDCP